MSTLRKRVTATAAIVIALTMTPALTGCFNNPVEGILEGVTGGNVDLGGQGVPQDFPTADVPLYQGEVIFGAGLGSGNEKIWNVSVRVSGADAINQIKSQLEGAGYESQSVLESADGATVAFTGPKFGVLVVIAKEDAGYIANYTVTPAGQ